MLLMSMQRGCDAECKTLNDVAGDCSMKPIFKFFVLLPVIAGCATSSQMAVDEVTVSDEMWRDAA